MVASLSDPAFQAAFGGIAVVLLKINLALYVPGSPFMYMNMVKNRKGAPSSRATLRRCPCASHSPAD